MNEATKIYIGIVLDQIAKWTQEAPVEASRAIEWWSQTLYGKPADLSKTRSDIQDQAAYLPHFADYVAGMLSLFSSTTEPERLFREVGRQNEGRESLTDEHLEAEVIVLDYLKTNAVDVDGYGVLVEDLADKVDTLRKEDLKHQQEIAAKQKAEKKAELERQLAELN